MCDTEVAENSFASSRVGDDSEYVHGKFNQPVSSIINTCVDVRPDELEIERCILKHFPSELS